MTHFGILCPPSTSHMNTMLPLAQELKSRGHCLTLIGNQDIRLKTEAAGIEFHAIGLDEYPPGYIAEAMSRLGQMRGITAAWYTINLFLKVTKVNLREAPSVLKALGIEALLVDQAYSEGRTLAEFLEIPFINICSAVVLNQEAGVPPCLSPRLYDPGLWARIRNQVEYKLLNLLTRPIQECVNEYRKGWNLDPHSHPNERYSRLAQISHQPAEFEFPRQHLPSCFHFVGPFHSEDSREAVSFPFERLTGQPMIYASLGSILKQRSNIFYNIAQACTRLDVQLVISLGGVDHPESLPKLPGNPLVVDYAPQLEILKKAALVITPAGMNTTLEALSNAVPLVAIPLVNDQPGIAARIAWAGVGEVIQPNRLSASRLRREIDKVLTSSFYKKSSLKMQDAIQKAGGVKRAADVVEIAIATGRPVLQFF